MDYACGSGADCDSILPSGPCYRPNTMLAHASFAFNSYWQRTKANGATCDFGGTAMLITKDPSKSSSPTLFTNQQY
jgi:DNA-directed RNA polymerase II subunit RPB1